MVLVALALSNNTLAQFSAEWESATESVELYNPKFSGSETIARY